MKKKILILWRDLDFWPYQVSTAGEVRNKLTAQLLTPINERGYLRVCLCFKGKRKMARIHCLVAETFIGKRPEGKFIAHMDGNSLNNRVENLSYVTQIENEAHKAIHGTKLMGEKHPNAKLTKVEVLEIRASKASIKSLAEKYKINARTILKIKSGERWQHILN